MTFPEESAYWTDDADGDPIIPSQLCGDLSIVDLAAVPPRRSCELPAGHSGWHEAAQLPFAPLRWVHAEQRDSKIAAPAGEVVSVPPIASPDADSVFIDVARNGEVTLTQTSGRALTVAVNGEWAVAPDRVRVVFRRAGVDEGRRQHAEEVERLQVLLDHAEQYARDLQDGSDGSERTEEQHAEVTVKGCLGGDSLHGKRDVHYWPCSTPGCPGHLCRLDGLPVHRG